MIILALLLSCVAAAVTVEKSCPDLPEVELKWPSSYTVSVLRMTLTSGLTETIEEWRTKRRMRQDYQSGAVKKFFRRGKGFNPDHSYEVYPETTETETNKIVCRAGAVFDTSDSMLPDTDDFNCTGEEILNNLQTFVFTSNVKTSIMDITRTLWASIDYDDEWIPVKYEVTAYNMWKGALKRHTVTEFNNYFPGPVSRQDFSVEEYGCETDSVTDEDDFDEDNPFEKFMEQHKRKYKHWKEHELRKQIFEENLRYINEKNHQNLGYTLAINEFSDRTEDELRFLKSRKPRPAGVGGTIPFPYTEETIKDIAETLPEEYDWRLYGAVSPIKNQATCGSCWTFGTTAAAEGALSLKNGGRMISLSNQAILDCAWGFGGAGCNGGYDIAAYHWMMEHGLPTEEEYGPYLNINGYCRIHNMTQTYKIRGFTNVTANSIEAVKVALVNHGPMSVSVDANSNFLSYSSGIFYDSECDPLQLNHEVALVGYGQRNGETYWIIKNSWGPQWGVEGYMYISAKDNNCGILTEPTYPVF